MELSADNLPVQDGKLYNVLENKLECVACAHRCKIREGKQGICKVRYNENGKLKVPYGYVSALNVDPIEKKPFYHVYPGSKAMSYGMLGCNLRCSYCQNWQISQAIKDPDAGVAPKIVSPDKIVNHALATGCRTVVSTYNEPLITSEWSEVIFKQAKKQKLLTGFVSSGNSTPEVIKFLRPQLDMYKIDLKSFNHRSYRELGASLDSILKSIESVYRSGLWMELVTLVVPRFQQFR